MKLYEVQRDLHDYFDSLDLSILCGVFEIQDAHKLADRIGITEGRLRHRFHVSLERLREISEKDAKYIPHYKHFKLIADEHFPRDRTWRTPRPGTPSKN